MNIPKTDAPAFEEPAPSWKSVRADGKRVPLFTCPNGHTGLLKGWDIADDGTVTPSVNCLSNAMPGGVECDFHDMIVLEDW